MRRWQDVCCDEEFLRLTARMPVVQVPVGSVRKGQCATLAIHPLSARQPAADGAAASSQPEEAQPAADGRADMSTAQQAGGGGECAGDPPRDPHSLPDTALRIQHVSFSPPGSEASIPAGAHNVTGASSDAIPRLPAAASGLGAALDDQARGEESGTAVAGQTVIATAEHPPMRAVMRQSRQSPLGEEARGAGPFDDGLRGGAASGGKGHRAAMPEGTLGVTAEDLDGLAAESQVQTERVRPEPTPCSHLSCCTCVDSLT